MHTHAYTHTSLPTSGPGMMKSLGQVRMVAWGYRTEIKGIPLTEC